MKFKVASKALYSTLSGVSKVINSKNTLTILDNFLWEVADGFLKVTASDSENTLSARIPVSELEGEASFCINARRISDVAKELPDVDVTVSLNEETMAIKLTFPGGDFDLVALNGDQYPRTIEDTDPETVKTMICPAKQIIDGIDHTIFAVGSDELRPQMMGIYWDIKDDGITFVATDTRKLVRYINRTSAPGFAASFILPLKPSVLLKTLLDKDQSVTVKMSQRSAVFETETLTLNCRFIKGNFPDYNRVIPQNNPWAATVDRSTILTAVRRVSVCADPAHGLIKFRFTPTQISLKVDDPNYNTFAHEEVVCDFTGSEMVIGFSSPYLMEIFSTITSTNIIIELADPSRPGLFRPDENEENTEMVAILMPMSIQGY